MITNKLAPNKDILKLREMQIDVSQIPYDNQLNVISNIDRIPQFYYYKLQIEPSSIISYTLSSVNIIPELTIVFIDTTGIIRTDNYPTDDSILSVYFGANSDLLKSIRMDFKILNYKEVDDKGQIYSVMKCIANIPNLYIKEFISYKNSNSYDVCLAIAKQCGLGFNSNVDKSNDVMNWINIGQTNMWFLQDVIKHSYINDNSFCYIFIDYNYCLNYINVEQALQDDILNAPVSGLNKVLGDDLDKVIPLRLSNDYSFQTTVNYFSDYTIYNKSTEISLNNGYLKKISYYDTYGAWNDKAGSLQIFDIDSISTIGSENNSIILKGSPTDLEYYSKNISYETFGAIDTDNVHKNYAYALIQNSQNVEDLQKISVNIILPNPNFAINRFENIELLFMKRASKEKNVRLSGKWLVTGISYEPINETKSKQIITAVKRELNVLE